jgi:hypothetical protein
MIMTEQADFKRRVRARMARTGESYTAARRQLLEARHRSGPDRVEAAGDGPAERMVAALHVTNGDCTDLAGTGLARRILVWFDVLHEGPVLALPDEELRRIRAGFLAAQAPFDGEGAEFAPAPFHRSGRDPGRQP